MRTPPPLGKWVGPTLSLSIAESGSGDAVAARFGIFLSRPNIDVFLNALLVRRS